MKVNAWREPRSSGRESAHSKYPVEDFWSSAALGLLRIFAAINSRLFAPIRVKTFSCIPRLFLLKESLDHSLYP